MDPSSDNDGCFNAAFSVFYSQTLSICWVVALSAIIVSFSTLRLDVLVPLVDKTKTMSAFLQICVFGPSVFCAVIFPFLLFTAPETFDFLSVEIITHNPYWFCCFCLWASRRINNAGIGNTLLEFGLIGKLQIARVLCSDILICYWLSFPELRLWPDFRTNLWDFVLHHDVFLCSKPECS